MLIIGAGPAGLGAAFQLTRKNLARVTVIDKSKHVGGISGSFEISGVHVDYGSHRLHPSCDPEIMQDIRSLLKDDLLDRPRHGRIRMCGRWIHFPLKPLDLLFHLPPEFSLGVVRDMVTKTLGKQSGSQSGSGEEFSSIMEAGLGRTVCQNFYFPYSQKLWGLPPERLSSVQARRRVSANSLHKMIRKVVAMMPFVKKGGAGRFFYPKKGFGQISESLYKAAEESGAEFFLDAPLKKVVLRDRGPSIQTVSFEYDGEVVEREADFIWSTISLPELLHSFEQPPPELVVHALDNIRYRSMILIYLVLQQSRFSEYDAHYFPEKDIPISRLSETKNYYNSAEPADCTVLCAELPCDKDGLEWKMTDAELGEVVRSSLESAGIPVRAPIVSVVSRRLSQAYPVYQVGYEEHFQTIDAWLQQVDNLISFGRQGLFVHDNIHLTLYMAYAAAKCLDSTGNFDRDRWRDFRNVFDTLVVED